MNDIDNLSYIIHSWILKMMNSCDQLINMAWYHAMSCHDDMTWRNITCLMSCHIVIMTRHKMTTCTYYTQQYSYIEYIISKPPNGEKVGLRLFFPFRQAELLSTCNGRCTGKNKQYTVGYLTCGTLWLPVEMYVQLMRLNQRSQIRLQSIKYI